MKELGYGRGYRYPHDEPDAFVETRNLPEALGGGPLLRAHRSEVPRRRSPSGCASGGGGAGRASRRKTERRGRSQNAARPSADRLAVPPLLSGSARAPASGGTRRAAEARERVPLRVRTRRADPIPAAGNRCSGSRPGAVGPSEIPVGHEGEASRVFDIPGPRLLGEISGALGALRSPAPDPDRVGDALEEDLGQAPPSLVSNTRRPHWPSVT